MTVADIRSRLTGRRRSPAGCPEVTETVHTRLSREDHIALQGVRLLVGTSCTYSELIRAMLQSAVSELLPADPYADLMEIESLPGGILIRQRARDPGDDQLTVTHTPTGVTSGAAAAQRHATTQPTR